MPCVAKHLLNCVLSITPGNFLALKTWNTLENVEASTGAVPLLSDCADGDVGVPTLTKFIFRLETDQLELKHVAGHVAEDPSYITERFLRFGH